MSEEKQTKQEPAPELNDEPQIGSRVIIKESRNPSIGSRTIQIRSLTESEESEED